MPEEEGYNERAHMEAIIRSGESVMWGPPLEPGQDPSSQRKRVYSTIESLPSAAELAKGNPAKQKAALAELEAKQAEITAQIEALGLDPVTLAPKGHKDDKPTGDDAGKQKGKPPDEGDGAGDPGTGGQGNQGDGGEGDSGKVKHTDK